MSKEDEIEYLTREKWMEIMMPFHGGNPQSHAVAMDEIYSDYFDPKTHKGGVPLYRRVQSDEGQKEQLEDKNRQRIFEVFSQYSTGEIKNLNVLEDEVIKSYDAQFGAPPARELDEEKIRRNLHPFFNNPKLKKKPTIAELEAILNGPPVSMTMLPNGEIIANQTLNEIAESINQAYQRGELFK